MKNEQPESGEDRIALLLTVDEALVLDAFLTRGQEAGDDHSSIEDQAELRVLWDVSAMLEAQLPIVNNPHYEQLLASARARVRDTTE